MPVAHSSPKPKAVPASPQFRAWFGQSRISERGGIPRLVFHGTAGHTGAFAPEMVGQGHVDLEEGTVFYFTDARANAAYYAKSRAKQTGQPGVILECYLSLQNPLVVDFEGMGLELLGEEIGRARVLGHDGLLAIDYDDGPSRGQVNHYLAFRPAQIKHASENCGAFDPSNPDIRA